MAWSTALKRASICSLENSWELLLKDFEKLRKVGERKVVFKTVIFTELFGKALVLRDDFLRHR